MKKQILLILVLVFAFVFANAQIQKKDKANFKEYEPGFYQNSILKDIRVVKEKKEVKKVDKRFQMDHKGLDLPNKVNLYKQEWYNPVLSQGNTGTCWCFATTSFFESEIYRLSGKKIKLSEIYTVYWEYVEKARGFVQSRGETAFSQGSEGNAATRMYKKYGIVPWEIYNGLPSERKYHTHAQMYKEMMAYLKSVKKNNAWNENEILSTIKSIMDFHIGEPPTQFEYEGVKYTPKSFLKDYLKLNMNDFVEILSYKQEPYWQKVEYKVADNWWHSKDYYNVPLNVYMDIMKKAIRKGYTMSIGGDVSEAGFDRGTQCAIIPSFDIPSQYIDENARQFRFSNRTTTDDHGMHLVGFLEKDGKDWYLIKDSSSGSRNNDEEAPEFGFYFFSEYYVKLKMMGFTVHKDVVKKILKKFD